GFRLARNGANHLLRQVHLFYLNHRYLNAPRRGVLVEYRLQAYVQLLALAQQFVQLGLPKDAAQGGLRKLRRGVKEIRNFYDCEPRLHDAKVDHGVDLDGHIVARHDILRRNFQGVDTQRNLYDAVDRREDQNDSRSLGLR